MTSHPPSLPSVYSPAEVLIVSRLMSSFRSFDGTQIAFHDEGDGPPVVLLHGFGSGGLAQYGPFAHARKIMQRVNEGFREVFGKAPPLFEPPVEGQPGLLARLVAAGARVVVPDLRGFGASDAPHGDAAYANSAMARDIVALAEHLDFAAFDLVGFSMGSGVVLRLLALRPDRVRSAVLAGLGDYVLEGEVMMWPEHWPLPPGLQRPVTKSAHAKLMAEVLERGEIVPGNLMSMSLVSVRITGADRFALASAVRGEVVPPIETTSLMAVRCPVLVLNGAEDVANQKISRLLEVMPTARCAKCAGTHHSTPWEPSFQQAVIDFLREHNA